MNLTRYIVVAKDLRHMVESGINIGLRPSENSHLAQDLKTIMQRDGGIQYLAIVDEAGNLIGQGKLPQQSKEEWWRLINITPVASHWNSSADDIFQVGMPFVNDFNIKSGAVIVGYDRAAIETATTDMLFRLALDISVCLVVMTLLTLGLVHVFTRGLAREIETVNASLQSGLQADAALVGGGRLLDAETAGDINEFNMLAQQVSVELREGEQMLQEQVRTRRSA